MLSTLDLRLQPPRANSGPPKSNRVVAGVTQQPVQSYRGSSGLVQVRCFRLATAELFWDDLVVGMLSRSEREHELEIYYRADRKAIAHACPATPRSVSHSPLPFPPSPSTSEPPCSDSMPP
eukprot:3793874-Rhodomonas_salina.4